MKTNAIVLLRSQFAIIKGTLERRRRKNSFSKHFWCIKKCKAGRFVFPERELQWPNRETNFTTGWRVNKASRSPSSLV
jgi:hypothetical protein